MNEYYDFTPITPQVRTFIKNELMGKLHTVTYNNVLNYLIKKNLASSDVLYKLPSQINNFRKYIGRLMKNLEKGGENLTLSRLVFMTKGYRGIMFEKFNDKGQMVIGLVNGLVQCGVDTIPSPKAKRVACGYLQRKTSPDFTRSPRIDINVPGDTSYHIKDLEGYEGIYKIDTNGDVWSIKRGRKLSTFNKNGIVCVVLSKNGYHKNFGLARLVAQSFIPNPNEYPHVHHKDKNPENNKVENLYWFKNTYGFVKNIKK